MVPQPPFIFDSLLEELFRNILGHEASQFERFPSPFSFSEWNTEGFPLFFVILQ